MHYYFIDDSLTPHCFIIALTTASIGCFDSMIHCSGYLNQYHSYHQLNPNLRFICRKQQQQEVKGNEKKIQQANFY